MNKSTLKKQIRQSFENSMCSAAFARLHSWRRTDLIDRAAHQVQHSGFTIDQATAFANDQLAFYHVIDMWREQDQRMAMAARKKIKRVQCDRTLVEKNPVIYRSH
jgi:hypothetical protein